jgi:uncharacterized protein DUF4276
MNAGIIAEDDSDVEVVSAITLELLKPHVIGFKKFVGGGCGKLRRKCAAWARNLVERDCSWIVVVHDLDENDELELQEQLTVSVRPAGAQAFVVLIPRREIEAWLLYDARAIATAFRQRPPLPQLPGNPELLPDPKRHLAEIVWRRYQKVYLHNVHNALIARNINVALLRRSRSFAPHLVFARRVSDGIRQSEIGGRNSRVR